MSMRGEGIDCIWCSWCRVCLLTDDASCLALDSMDWKYQSIEYLRLIWLGSVSSRTYSTVQYRKVKYVDYDYCGRGVSDACTVQYV